VADAVEAPGQHVQEKAPDELARVKPHRLPAARPVDAIVSSSREKTGRRTFLLSKVRSADRRRFSPSQRARPATYRAQTSGPH
jgi:hypothetical protein